MASTSLPAVRAGVLSALEGADDLESVHIADGGTEPHRAAEYVWMFKARATREFRTIQPAPTPQDENVKVSLRIVAIKDTKDNSKSEERATELLETVETAL